LGSGKRGGGKSQDIRGPGLHPGGAPKKKTIRLKTNNKEKKDGAWSAVQRICSRAGMGLGACFPGKLWGGGSSAFRAGFGAHGIPPPSRAPFEPGDLRRGKEEEEKGGIRKGSRGPQESWSILPAEGVRVREI